MLSILASDEDSLRRLGIRPTPQRLAVLRLLSRQAEHHVTAQDAFERIRAQGHRLTLGTIYNVLNDFARAGLVTRIDMGERTSYCGNREPHQHYFDENSKRLFDIVGSQPELTTTPVAPEGMVVVGVEIIIRIQPKREA